MKCLACSFFSPLQEPSLLHGKVTLHQVTAGTVVSRQGDQVNTLAEEGLWGWAASREGGLALRTQEEPCWGRPVQSSNQVPSSH